MLDAKPNQKIFDHIAMLIEEARKSTPELSKRGINYDHKDIVELASDAALYGVLCEVRDELRMANEETRRKRFPLSMFNLK